MYITVKYKFKLIYTVNMYVYHCLLSFTCMHIIAKCLRLLLYSFGVLVLETWCVYLYLANKPDSDFFFFPARNFTVFVSVCVSTVSSWSRMLFLA